MQMHLRRITWSNSDKRKIFFLNHRHVFIIQDLLNALKVFQFLSRTLPMSNQYSREMNVNFCDVTLFILAWI